VAWVCERASEKPCNKLDISHWYMMGLWKAPWWHLGLVSTSTLLLHQLGEDGKAERGVPATARAAELASQVQQEQSERAERAELDCPPIGWIGCKPARGPRQRAQSDRQKRSLGARRGQVWAATSRRWRWRWRWRWRYQLAIASNPGVFCFLTVATGRWARDSTGHCSGG
jgi:hypothetical protein